MQTMQSLYRNFIKRNGEATTRYSLTLLLTQFTFFAILVLWNHNVYAESDAKGQITTLKENGGWCWFEDERVIADHGQLIIGSVKSPEGDIDVSVYDLETGKSQPVTLHEGLENDDHASPALLVLPNGHYLAVYSKHGSDRLMRWRISTRAGDGTEWNPEQTLDVGAGATYSNLFCLKGENNRIYNFHRGIGWDPNFMISDDLGKSWRYGGHLLRNENDPDNQMRPYLKYTSNHEDTIHFIATEAHPQQNESTSIFHGFIQNGKVHRSDGTVIRDLNEGPIEPSELTRVFQGDAQKKAWTIDLQLDALNYPYIIYSVHYTNEDHRYRYARWDGQKWQDQELAQAGTRLYPGEEHYTGLAALDPHDPNRLYISSDAHPITGQPLISKKDNERHYEIFLGVKNEGETTWNWIPITENSTADNLRPIIPAWNEKHQGVFWLKGKYNSYTDYDLDILGMIERR